MAWSIALTILVACVLLVQYEQYRAIERMADSMAPVIPVDPGVMSASWYSGGQLHVCKVKQGEFDPNETAAECSARFVAKIQSDLVTFPKDNG